MYYPIYLVWIFVSIKRPNGRTDPSKIVNIKGGEKRPTNLVFKIKSEYFFKGLYTRVILSWTLWKKENACRHPFYKPLSISTTEHSLFLSLKLCSNCRTSEVYDGVPLKTQHNRLYINPFKILNKIRLKPNNLYRCKNCKQPYFKL